MRSPPAPAVLLVAALVAAAALGSIAVWGDWRHAGTGPAARPADANPCVGAIREPPARTTLFTVQGARGSEKTAALLVGVRPNGSVVGVHDDSAHGRWWVYDVDRLPNGNLLVATTEPGITVVEEVDPGSGEHVSVRRFRELHDTHDVDLINGDELLMTDMSRDGDDRVLVYDLARGAVVWEYRFADHPDRFPRSGGGEFGGDWTHVNDVERIGDGLFMASVRNFDTVVAIDRETKAVVWRLGADDDRSTLFEQHNPDYLEGAGDTPTVLVADSRNDRVVEYARVDGEWRRTWVLRGGGLDEPRDADRLPNGNTLVVDRRGDRVLEVTPQGRVVWEFYAPWQPYDAERIGTGDESSGPTMRELGTTGVSRLRGSAGFGTERVEACYDFLTSWDGGSRLLPNGSPPADSGTPAAAGRTPTGGSALGTSVRWPDARTAAVGIAVLVGLAGVVAWLARR